MKLEAIQSALRERKFDAWLFYDHHHRDPIAYRVLGLRDDLMVTRRWFYLVPASGEPEKLVHRIEAGHLDSLPGQKRTYSSWQELQHNLQEMVRRYPNLAMQYSPQNAIPYVGLVDAGTVELLRSFGVNVLSSGDLVSRFEAVLTDKQIASHYAARDAVDRITADAFKAIGQRVRNGGTDEFEMAQWISEAFRRENLISENSPIVAVNSHSGDPHFEPRADRSARMKEGDFVLLDIWAKTKDPDACYYDITWTGFIGKNPSDRQREVFAIVRDARKLGCETVQKAFAAGKKIAGWEVDKAVRDFIAGKGYGDKFIHRTGHNISSAIHGNGANIDNLETKDEREILANTCFSIEPGIYLPEFGVRSEVNVLTRPGKAEVTGRQQEELVLI
ncbi:MAG TPA: Xaa-Pro peptidase family protein [Terriglobales bacterium]|nr:Xaa-Pro peptidase family protein [Terriglobales bacterium]